jgi:hypothetical protein
MKKWLCILFPLWFIVTIAIVVGPPMLLDIYVLSHYMSQNISGPISVFIWILVILSVIGYQIGKKYDEI